MVLRISEIVQQFRPDFTTYESLYKHLHSNPELSFQEHETSAKIQHDLQQHDLFRIQSKVGRTGVAAVLENGHGPNVLLRADIDALPIEEKTGLPYASTKRMKNLEGIEKPVMHVSNPTPLISPKTNIINQACGHDMHTTALLAAASLLIKARHHWSGTLILCFQPAEEVGAGAQAMVDDGLYLKVPVPDVVLGGHVMPFRSGYIGTRRGLMASAADSFRLTIHGHGGHASQPHRSRDPILTAAHTITRLQTIVARETNPTDSAVVTVSAIHAGDAENVIPTKAQLKLNIRTFHPDTRARVLASVKRIVDAEALAGDAPKPPDLKPTSSFPFLMNDDAVTAKLETSFAAHFQCSGQNYDSNTIKLGGSEDFGILATAVNRPANYWCYGGIDPAIWDKAEEAGKLESLPFNHSPYFAPVVQPTLMVATDAYAVAALTWLT